LIVVLLDLTHDVNTEISSLKALTKPSLSFFAANLTLHSAERIDLDSVRPVIREFLLFSP